MPASADELSRLKAGDTVHLSGILLTGAAHKQYWYLNKDSLPFNLENQGIYYTGCPGAGKLSSVPAGRPSSQMDSYAPILDLGLKVMIGRPAQPGVIAAMVRSGAVYLAAVGGAGALLPAA